MFEDDCPGRFGSISSSVLKDLRREIVTTWFLSPQHTPHIVLHIYLEYTVHIITLHMAPSFGAA